MQMCLKPLPLLFPLVPGTPSLHHFHGKEHVNLKVKAILVVVGSLKAEMVAMVVVVEVVDDLPKKKVQWEEIKNYNKKTYVGSILSMNKPTRKTRDLPAKLGPSNIDNVPD